MRTGSQRSMRVGIVGCGAVAGAYHLPILLSLPDVKISFLCDRNHRAAQEIKDTARLSAPVTTSVDDLVGAVDVALVATPPASHLNLTCRLASAGIDVLCEKPVGMNGQEVREMTAAGEAHGRMLSAGLFSRFAPNNSLLTRFLAAGEPGEIHSLELEFGAVLDWEMTSNSYYDRRQTGGGVLYDSGIHMLDRFVSIFGKPAVKRYQDDSFGGVESNALLEAEVFWHGAAVPLMVRMSWTHELSNRLVVRGSTCDLHLYWKDYDAIYIRREVGGSPLEMRVKSPGSAVTKSQDLLRAQWEDFLEAARTRRAGVSAIATAVAAQEWIDEAYATREHLPQPWMETHSDEYATL